MKIWSDENGAADGGLDATLAASPCLQRDTLKYLVSISQTLTESKSIRRSRDQTTPSAPNNSIIRVHQTYPDKPRRGRSRIYFCAQDPDYSCY